MINEERNNQRKDDRTKFKQCDTGMGQEKRTVVHVS
jgi:hypothetical protein